MSSGRPTRPPLSPKEAWLSDGRQVLHFRPTIWDRWNQRLVITSGELLADQPVPLLKKRWELSRQEVPGERSCASTCSSILPRSIAVKGVSADSGASAEDVGWPRARQAPSQKSC